MNIVVIFGLLPILASSSPDPKLEYLERRLLSLFRQQHYQRSTTDEPAAPDHDGVTQAAVDESTNVSTFSDLKPTPNMSEGMTRGRDGLAVRPEIYMLHVTQALCVMLEYIEGLQEAHGALPGQALPTINDEEGFPYAKAGRLLNELCSVIHANSPSESLRLAGLFMKQMAENEKDISQRRGEKTE